MKTYCPYCMSRIQTGERCLRCGKSRTDYHPPNHHLPPATLLQNRYSIGKVLGEGGFGITYLGFDTVLERKIAVKEYFPSVFVRRESTLTLNVTCYTEAKRTLYEKGRDQFLQEARVMARLEQIPEIVHVLDFFPANDTAYIVMEFLEGDTFRTLLVKQKRIPAKTLFEMMEPVLRALAAAHSVGVIHRDISPDNIMVLNSGQVKLLDFGCARNVDETQTMTVMLKHGYAPIEQYTGHNQGPWTDIYALCATLYCCLTGKVPPRALTRLDNKDVLIPPNQAGAALTTGQEQALMKGLAVMPKDRWENIADLYAGLYGTVMKRYSWQQAEEQETEIVTTGLHQSAEKFQTASNITFPTPDLTPNPAPVPRTKKRFSKTVKGFFIADVCLAVIIVCLIVGKLLLKKDSANVAADDKISSSVSDLNTQSPVPDKSADGDVDGDVIDSTYYQITIPKSWRSRVACQTAEYDGIEYLEFYHVTSLNKGMGGFLFAIGLFDEVSDIENMPGFEVIGTISVTSSKIYTVVVEYPTDVQFSDEEAEDYYSLREDIPSVLDTFQIKPQDSHSR